MVNLVQKEKDLELIIFTFLTTISVTGSNIAHDLNKQEKKLSTRAYNWNNEG